jgi:hypothetical protein
MRKIIELTGKACESENLSDWRQYRFNQKQLKKRYRKAQKINTPAPKMKRKKPPVAKRFGRLIESIYLKPNA